MKRGVVVTRSGRKNTLVMLTRFPRLGEVKTRLVPPLSSEEALALHDRLARHTLFSLLAVQASGEARVEVRTDAPSPRMAHAWLGSGFVARDQGDGSGLGERIRLAFDDALRRGAERAVVVGSDCPGLSAQHVRDAISLLDEVDVVLGPAADGGYYLVALRRSSATSSVPVLFNGIPWGTDAVLEDTLAICEEHCLAHALLERLPDVDRPEDLPDAERALAAGAVDSRSRVSVIIPTLDEAAVIRLAIESAASGGAHEVIVVDGGSQDNTCELAEKSGARVMHCNPGRALQMNAGAAAASGDVLLFLHADTVLPRSAAELVRSTLSRPGTVAGAFDFAVPRTARHTRLISAVGRTRARVTQRPFGDQGLFLPAWVFRELGGFAALPTMEDYEMVNRLRRIGHIEILDEVAVSSARTWERRGLVRVTLTNLAVIVGYRLGIAPERLALWRKGATAR